MSYIRDKFFNLKSMAYSNFFAMWHRIFHYKKKCGGAAFYNFTLRKQYSAPDSGAPVG
jgi:hypothetical protein